MHFIKVSSSIISINDVISICFKDIHSENAPFPIDMTEDGILILSNDEHLENARFPIDITDDGIEIWVNDVQLVNELFPIVVTEDGIEIWVNVEHPENALFDIVTIVDGREIFVKDPILLKLTLSVDLTDDEIIKWHFGEQKSKALLSIFVKKGSTMNSFIDEQP